MQRLWPLRLVLDAFPRTEHATPGSHLRRAPASACETRAFSLFFPLLQPQRTTLLRLLTATFRADADGAGCLAWTSDHDCKTLGGTAGRQRISLFYLGDRSVEAAPLQWRICHGLETVADAFGKSALYMAALALPPHYAPRGAAARRVAMALGGENGFNSSLFLHL